MKFVDRRAGRLNNFVMPSFLARQLDHFGQQVRSGAGGADGDGSAVADDAAEAVATAVYLLGRIEAAAARAQPTPPAWDESAARRFVPLFRDWFEYATRVVALVRDGNARGFPVEGREEFIHRYNVAKMMAVDFERTAEAQGQWERGERHGRPLEEVMDELRGRTGAAGG